MTYIIFSADEKFNMKLLPLQLLLKKPVPADTIATGRDAFRFFKRLYAKKFKQICPKQLT